MEPVFVLTYETPKWYLLQLLICVAVKFLKISFAWTTSVWKWRVTKILNLQHITLIFVLIILFLIFQCVLKFYYIQFNRLVNRSNCFHLMTSFMNLFVLFKMSVDINTWRAAIGPFGNVSMGSSIFFICLNASCAFYVVSYY